MNKLRILVVEDDREINRLVTDSMISEGFQVTSAFSGVEAVSLFSQNEFQLVILDLMIPEKSGYEVLSRIRTNHNTPVLILSAKSSEADKIIGLGLGADDYISKPFSVGELTARVHAQLRRYLKYSSGTNDSGIIRCGQIEINTHTFKVKIAEREVSLTSKEFDILKLFMQNPQKVFTKSQLFKSIWNEDYLHDENTIMVHIHRLRDKIEQDPANPQIIQTVWGIGYKLVFD